MVLGETQLFWNWLCSDPGGVTVAGSVALSEVNTKSFNLFALWGGFPPTSKVLRTRAGPGRAGGGGLTLATSFLWASHNLGPITSPVFGSMAWAKTSPDQVLVW